MNDQSWTQSMRRLCILISVERCYRWFKTERGYLMENVDAYHLRGLVVYGVAKGSPLGF